MSKVYQYIVDVVARTQNFTARMREVIRQQQESTRQQQESTREAGVLEGGLANIAKGMAAAFSVHQLMQFGKELVVLSGEVQEVERAFLRIADKDYLYSLRQSTHNTVSDLELMKRAVTANNFGIPLQSLGKLFEFAAARAQATGQSVDYLVDSIVTGIGRKSPLILDNLGISAVALKDKMGGVAVESASIGDVATAVGRIAGEELQKMGGYVETTETKISQLSTQWANVRKEMSQSPAVINAASNSIELLSIVLTQLNYLIEKYSKNTAKWYDGFIGPIKGAANVYNLFKDSFAAVSPEAQSEKRQKEQRESLSMYGEDTGMSPSIQRKQLEGSIANLTKYRNELAAAGKDTTEVGKQLASYQRQLAKIAPQGGTGKKETEKTAYEQLGLSIAALTKQQQALALAGKDTSGIAAHIAALQKQKEAADQLVESQKTTVAKTAYEQLSNSIETLVKRQQELAKAGKDTSGIQEQVTALERQKAVTDKLVQSRNPEVAQTAYNALSGSVALLVAQYEKLNREGKDVTGISAQMDALGRQKETADLVAKSLAATMKPEGYDAVTAAISELTKEQENLTLAGKDTTGISAQIAALERLKENVDFLAASYRLAARLGKEVLQLPADKIENRPIAQVAGGITTKEGKMAVKGADGEVKKMGLVIDPDMGEKTKEKIQDIIEQSEELRKTWNDLTQEAGVNFQVIGDAIGGAAGSWLGFFGYLIQQIPVLIAQITALATAHVAASEAEQLADSHAAIAAGTKQASHMPFPFNLIAIAATVAGIVSALSSASKIKRYEAGGIAYAPTVGLFGEYPGASTNPEVVAPLDRLRDLIKPAGGTTVIMPAGVEIDGYKLRVLLKRVDNSISKRV